MTDPTFEDRSAGAGFPEVVDDDSPERDRVPEPEGAALPSDTGYVGTDAVGTTVQEEIEGESLDEKLSHEVPDADVDPSSRDDALRADTDGPGGGDPLGELVSPDGDAGFDTERDEVAREAGRGGGSPEELAMHLEPGEG